MKNIIITADDYGMCDSVNRAIDRCVESGLVSSTNVMANMPLVCEASVLRQKYPHISVGLHWNITAGKPVCKKEEIPTLVNENGEFYSLLEFKSRYKSGKITDKDIKTELVRQYDIVKDLCGQPDYWNTHQNSSLDFKTYKIFFDTAKELGIHHTRNFQRAYANTHDKLGIKKRITEIMKKVLFDVWYGIIMRLNGVHMPDARMIYFDDTNLLVKENFTSNIKWGLKKNIEVVIHPALDGDCIYFGNISSERIKQYNVFSDKKTAEFIKKCDINIINYSKVR